MFIAALREKSRTPCVLTVMGNAIYRIWEDATEYRALLVAEREARVFDAEEFNRRLRAEQELRDKDRETYERSRIAVVTAVEHPYSPYGASKCVLIVDWPAQIALQPATHVTISTDMGTHERPLGNGWVRPKETNGKSVVTLDTPHRDAEPFITALLNKTAGDGGLSKIRIGPAADLQNISHPPSMALAGAPVHSAPAVPEDR
jgi:S-adenosylmethionine/arginine decarboxylase-like enzyme